MPVVQLVGSVTVGEEIGRVAGVARAADDCAPSEAAAICDGFVRSTDIPQTAPAVGLMTKLSPAFAAPFTTMDMPAATKGSALVPVPVMVTACPVVVSCSCQALPRVAELVVVGR